MLLQHTPHPSISEPCHPGTTHSHEHRNEMVFTVRSHLDSKHVSETHVSEPHDPVAAGITHSGFYLSHACKFDVT